MYVCLVCFDSDGPGSCARCGVERLSAERADVRDEIHSSARKRAIRSSHRVDVSGGLIGGFLGLGAGVGLALSMYHGQRNLPLFGSHRLVALITGLSAWAGVVIARRLRPPVHPDRLSLEEAVRVAKG